MVFLFVVFYWEAETFLKQDSNNVVLGEYHNSFLGTCGIGSNEIRYKTLVHQIYDHPKLMFDLPDPDVSEIHFHPKLVGRSIFLVFDYPNSKSTKKLLPQSQNKPQVAKNQPREASLQSKDLAKTSCSNIVVAVCSLQLFEGSLDEVHMDLFDVQRAGLQLWKDNNDN